MLRAFRSKERFLAPAKDNRISGFRELLGGSLNRAAGPHFSAAVCGTNTVSKWLLTVIS